MTVLRIRLYGDPILREKAAAITQFDTELKKFAQSLIETLHAEPAFGVAAPQVGQALRIFGVEMLFDDHHYSFSYSYDGKTPPLELLFPLIVINPIFLERSETKSTLSESCLSIPSVPIPVTRPERVKMQFQDLEGNFHTLEADGILARCLQHEYDHLEGVLITDHATPSLFQRLRAKLIRIKRDQKMEEKRTLKEHS